MSDPPRNTCRSKYSAGRISRYERTGAPPWVSKNASMSRISDGSHWAPFSVTTTLSVGWRSNTPPKRRNQSGRRVKTNTS